MLYVSEIQQVTPYIRIAVVSDRETGEVVGSIRFGDSVSERRVREMAPLLVKKSKKTRG
ncbi:hypothetical protein [Paenibacillus sp. AR247]|uniref:hypothetical protein n=1 Tax=Paenibacillus sp. AR247 TaxID=1631599 RepID=UPI0015E2B476|nr:hypothetical protein [Paenibacillus sp. AR247]